MGWNPVSLFSSSSGLDFALLSSGNDIVVRKKEAQCMAESKGYDGSPDGGGGPV